MKNEEESEKSTSWNQNMQDGGIIWGMKIITWSYKYLGRFITSMILHVIVFCYFIGWKQARTYSRTYWKRLEKLGVIKKVKWYHLYKHFYSFSLNSLDRVASWSNSFKEENIIAEPQDEQELNRILEEKQAIMLFMSHQGNPSLLQMHTENTHDFKINIIGHLGSNKKFHDYLKSIKKDRIIFRDSEDIGPEVIYDLKEETERGNWVSMSIDRTAINEPDAKNDIEVDFLGGKINLPIGPWVIAYTLGCPIYLVHCMYENGKYRIFFKKFRDKLEIPRKTRQADLKKYMQEYADYMADFCKRYPEQWYNFYDYWNQQKSKTNDNSSHKDNNN